MLATNAWPNPKKLHPSADPADTARINRRTSLSNEGTAPLPRLLPSEGIAYFEYSRIDTWIGYAAAAGVGEMMVAVFHLAGAAVRLVNLHSRAQFECVVDRGAVQDRN